MEECFPCGILEIIIILFSPWKMPALKICLLTRKRRVGWVSEIISLISIVPESWIFLAAIDVSLPVTSWSRSLQHLQPPGECNQSFYSCIWGLFPSWALLTHMSSLFPATSWVYMASLKFPHLDYQFQSLLTCPHSLLSMDLMATWTSPLKHLYQLQTTETSLARWSERGFNGSGAFKIVGEAAGKVSRPLGILPWLF